MIVVVVEKAFNKFVESFRVNQKRGNNAQQEEIKGIVALYTRWLSLGWMFVLLPKWIVYSCLRNVCISSDERPLWLM